MTMDAQNFTFRNGAELLDVCTRTGKPISAVMRLRECALFDASPEFVDARMYRALEIMKNAASAPLQSPRSSMGGLIGGEAQKLAQHVNAGSSALGTLPGKAAAYAMAVLEVNASMGLIVAAPTAGAAGVVPGVLLALRDERGMTDEQLVDGLFNAAAIGFLAMRNASVAGAVGGCQAEVGVAAAMAASAAVELLGATPQMCLAAASIVFMNMLGLVCDPVGGLVEMPCQVRNAAGAANALVAVDVALSGAAYAIPFDEMLDAMYKVGRKLPPSLRETALGGTAATPSACRLCGKHA